jgi:hypothetical protein
VHSVQWGLQAMRGRAPAVDFLFWEVARQFRSCSTTDYNDAAACLSSNSNARIIAASSKVPNIKCLLSPAYAFCLQVCVQKQDHGLDTGLDVFLIPHCKPALPDGPGVLEPEPV